LLTYPIKEITIDVRNTDEPKSAHTELVLSPIFLSFWFPSFYDAEAADAIEENTSGAPLPNAKNVTPASDSLILNLTVIYSRLGERYSSAVDARLYMKTKIIINPIGVNTMYFPTFPIGWNLQ